jgi:hypothetical protein
MSSTVSAPRIPRCVTKYDLITFFECNYRYLWRRILTDDLLETWGYTYADIKNTKKLPPDLTRSIYDHYGITDLDAKLSDEIREKEEEEKVI